MSLIKKGDTVGAFQIASALFELTRRLDLPRPDMSAYRLIATVLFSQLAFQLGRNAEARSAAMETLEAINDDPDGFHGEKAQAEIEKLKYYAEVPLD